MPRAYLVFAVALVVLVVPSVCLATPSNEMSLDKWWAKTFVGDVDSNGSFDDALWGMRYDGANWTFTANALDQRLKQAGDVEVGRWNAGPTGEGHVTVLLLEQAGFAASNQLWWYDWDASSNPQEGDGNPGLAGDNPIFVGTDAPGAKQTFDIGAGGSVFGFNLKSKSTGTALGDGFWSYGDDWDANTLAGTYAGWGPAGDASPPPDPDGGGINTYGDEDHLLVALVPDGTGTSPFGRDATWDATDGLWRWTVDSTTVELKPGKFLLAWEDLNHCPGKNQKVRSGGVGTQNIFLENNAGSVYEPDYNDMLIAYVDVAGSDDLVPEPLSIGLLGLACAGIGATLRKRRSK
jgi:hypothetical protein